VAFDLAGQLTVIVGIGALVYGLIAAGSAGSGPRTSSSRWWQPRWDSSGFATSQACGRHPIGSPGAAAVPGVVISALSGSRSSAPSRGRVPLQPVPATNNADFQPCKPGWCFLPTTLLSAAISPVSTWLTHRYSPLVPIFGGLTMMALAMLALAGLPATDSNLADLRAPDPDRDHRPTGHATNYRRAARLRARPPIRLASGVFNSSRQIGAPCPSPLFGALLQRQRPADHRPTAQLIITAVVVLLAATANALFRPHHLDSLPVPSRRDDL